MGAIPLGCLRSQVFFRGEMEEGEGIEGAATVLDRGGAADRRRQGAGRGEEGPAATGPVLVCCG
jgi:hypothetical protein